MHSPVRVCESRGCITGPELVISSYLAAVYPKANFDGLALSIFTAFV